VFEGSRIGGDAARRDGTVAQRPQEGLIPDVWLRLLASQGKGDPLVGFINRAINGDAILALETILAVPDLEGRFLQGDQARGLSLSCTGLDLAMFNQPHVNGTTSRQ
jgi:hypothetical protein